MLESRVVHLIEGVVIARVLDISHVGYRIVVGRKLALEVGLIGVHGRFLHFLP